MTATVHSDPPVKVTLVDEEGKLVGGASVKRQLKRYNGTDLPETFSVYGLHPQRVEFLVFTHEQRGLIGTLSTKWTSQPVRLVMKPAARLIGRITDAEGKPDFDFAIRVLGLGVMPDTYLAGEFRLVVPAGVEVRGEFVRKRPDLETRPSVRAAFGPLSPMSETVNLGNRIRDLIPNAVAGRCATSPTRRAASCATCQVSCLRRGHVPGSMSNLGHEFCPN